MVYILLKLVIIRITWKYLKKPITWIRYLNQDTERIIIQKISIEISTYSVHNYK